VFVVVVVVVVVVVYFVIDSIRKLLDTPSYVPGECHWLYQNISQAHSDQ